MLPISEHLQYKVELHIASRVLLLGIGELLNEEGYIWCPWLRTPPIAIWEASQLSSKIFSKSGYCKPRAFVILCLILSNARTTTLVHLKSPWFMQSVIGAMMLLKFRKNHQEKVMSSWKLSTSDIFSGVDHSMIAFTLVVSCSMSWHIPT